MSRKIYEEKAFSTHNSGKGKNREFDEELKNKKRNHLHTTSSIQPQY